MYKNIAAKRCIRVRASARPPVAPLTTLAPNSARCLHDVRGREYGCNLFKYRLILKTSAVLRSVSPGSHRLQIVNLESMAPRMLMLLPCIFCLAFVVLEASSQDTNHHRPRDPPLGTLSKYNEKTKTYEPVSA